MTAAVRMDGVHKRFGARTVLRGVSTRIAQGEVAALVGGNGAGKTTLVKCMLDFCTADAGTIELFGADSRQPHARSGLSYLPERFAPPHYLSALEFLRYAAGITGDRMDAARCHEILDLLGFDPDARQRPVRKLSKGTIQKLGLAAALAPRRRLYVLDEPMSGLDPMSRIAVKSLLRHVREAGGTLLMTSHVLADVAELSGRMLLLHDGRILFDGAPAGLLERYAESSLEQAFMRCVRDEHPG